MKKVGYLSKTYTLTFFGPIFEYQKQKDSRCSKNARTFPQESVSVGININQGKLKIRWFTGDCLSGASSKKGNMKRLEASVGQKETCSQSHLLIQPKKKTGNNGIGPQHASRGVPRMRISWVSSQGRKIQYRNTIKPLIRPLLRAFHKLAFFGFPVPNLAKQVLHACPSPKKISGEANVCWLRDSTYW